MVENTQEHCQTGQLWRWGIRRGILLFWKSLWSSLLVTRVVSIQMAPGDEVHINLTSYTYYILGSQNVAAGQQPQFCQHLTDKHFEQLQSTLMYSMDYAGSWSFTPFTWYSQSKYFAHACVDSTLSSSFYLWQNQCSNRHSSFISIIILMVHHSRWKIWWKRPLKKDTLCLIFMVSLSGMGACMYRSRVVSASQAFCLFFICLDKTLPEVTIGLKWNTLVGISQTFTRIKILYFDIILC